ncbi:MAG TPA: hypothetical protein PK335_11655 [Draconibacterium sp.]|nr:hypothetical protein [Draconibacterium sp.]
MKTTKLFFTGMLLILISLGLQAQNKTGIDYFKGKWKVSVNSAYGNQEMLVVIAQDGDKVVGKINNSEGEEMYKVNSTSVKEKEATLNFNGSQGAVDMTLTVKDDDAITVSVMGGMATGTGERMKK